MKSAVEGLIAAAIDELNLSLTLRSGQAFRWRQTGDHWLGVVDNQFVVQLKQTPTHVEYKVFNPVEDNCQSIDGTDPSSDDPKPKKRLKTESKATKNKFYEDLITNYFRLDINLNDLYKNWSKSDQNFAKVSEKLRGIRILRQNPMETVFSFICSSNNNITRISKMIDNLCQKYGQELYESEEFGTVYSFPTIQRLAAEEVESELKSLGFGYRSKFIQKTAKNIVDSEPKCPEIWFTRLRSMPYSEARDELMKLPGVGPKVADCIALMAFDHLESIPVDTHVFQIAANQYLPHLKKNKSLTDKSYKEIGKK